MSHNFTKHFYPLLLISALRQESSVVTEQFPNSIEKNPQGYTLFRFQNREIFLLEIGSGKRMESSKLKSAIVQLNPGFIVNFGICGALDLQIKLNENYLVNTVSCNKKSEINLSPDLELLEEPGNPKELLPRARLLTVKEPVLDSDKREELRRITLCELVDMEAYYIAQTARELGIPLAILKQATDYADNKAMQQVRQTKKIWQESLYQGLVGFLNL